MHTNRAIFSKPRGLFTFFKKRQGKPPTLHLSSCAPKLIHFLKRGWCSTQFTFDFKMLSFTWLVAAILVYLIMAETDIECGHTKTTLYACGVNKSRKIITFSYLNSTNFKDNFKENFMWEKVKLTLVVLILSFGSFGFFHHLYVWNVLKLLFEDFFHIAFGYTISL